MVVLDDCTFPVAQKSLKRGSRVGKKRHYMILYIKVLCMN